MERRGRGGGKGAGWRRSKYWYWALVGLWVRCFHDGEKRRADFSCAGSRGSYKVLLAFDQSTFGRI